MVKEKESKIINNIIEYLIDKKIIEKYKSKINELGLSEKDKNYLLNKIEEKEKKIHDEEKYIDGLNDEINLTDND